MAQTPVCSAPREIDLELLTFVERYATNLIRWDLLVFFGRNPETRDTAPHIATCLGRKLTVVNQELEDLVYLGIVNREIEGPLCVYRLTTSANIRTALRRLVEHTPR
jgi:predicted transcriptional regulator